MNGSILARKHPWPCSPRTAHLEGLSSAPGWWPPQAPAGALQAEEQRTSLLFSDLWSQGSHPPGSGSGSASLFTPRALLPAGGSGLSPIHIARRPRHSRVGQSRPFLMRSRRKTKRSIDLENCVQIDVHVPYISFLWVGCWSYGNRMFDFTRNGQAVFRGMCHFAIPPATQESQLLLILVSNWPCQHVLSEPFQ